jgi:hypothetical protein
MVMILIMVANQQQLKSLTYILMYVKQSERKVQV